MHGLPEQNVEDALFDLKTAIDHQPPHLSWYQLTIEPNTLFHSKPPVLPKDELLWQIQEQGHQMLEQSGYQRYEISGYAKPGQQCRHNLNYWRFGDYLGIGCEAHGKVALPDENRIIRTTKIKHPKGYMDLSKPYLNKLWEVEKEDQAFEYFMNRLRLMESFSQQELEQRTALTRADVAAPLSRALAADMLTENNGHWQVTEKGHLYLNELLEWFV